MTSLPTHHIIFSSSRLYSDSYFLLIPSCCFFFLFFFFQSKDQALLVSNKFVVTFDGHVFELPGSCPLLLAQDASIHPSFTLLLSADPQSLLLIHMNNHTIHIHRNGQVCVLLWMWTKLSTCLWRSRKKINCLWCRWRWTAVKPWHTASSVMMDWL